jgi:hypothetical protein
MRSLVIRASALLLDLTRYPNWCHQEKWKITQLVWYFYSLFYRPWRVCKTTGISDSASNHPWQPCSTKRIFAGTLKPMLPGSQFLRVISPEVLSSPEYYIKATSSFFTVARHLTISQGQAQWQKWKIYILVFGLGSWHQALKILIIS